MKIQNDLIKFRSEGFCHFRDLTGNIKELIKKTKIKNGSVLIYSKHTTMAIRINEQENGFHKDFKDFLHKLAPEDAYWRHNDLTIRTENLVCEPGATDCLNGHSHCLHLLMSTSETIPIIDGKLLLGRWQRIFAVELDVARNREVHAQVSGV